MEILMQNKQIAENAADLGESITAAAAPVVNVVVEDAAQVRLRRLPVQTSERLRHEPPQLLGRRRSQLCSLDTEDAS